MTSQERKDELERMQERYDAPGTTHEEKVEIILQVREWAEEEMPESRCSNCGHAGMFIPDTRPRVEGHCYSEDGAREYQSLSRTCEYCFDKMFLDADDPRRAEWFPETLAQEAR